MMKYLFFLFTFSNLVNAHGFSQIKLSEKKSTLQFKVCSDKIKAEFQINLPIMDFTFETQKDGIKSVRIHQAVATEFKKSDVKPEDLKILLGFAGISDFNSGIQYSGKTEKDNQQIDFIFFEYNNSQISALTFVQGWPMPLGKTEDCTN